MPRYQDVADSELRFRQVHLDFHTSEHCRDVGNDFDHRVFSAYRSHGQQYLRDIVMNALDMLCPVRQVQVYMPSGGRMTFMRQEEENRWILHLLYAVPMHRGEDIDVIEDIVPLYNIPCHLSIENSPERVYLAPSGENIKFTCDGGKLFFVVPELFRHAMVVIK